MRLVTAGHRVALTVEGRLRLVRRCQTRPIALVAAEAGISRACLSEGKTSFDIDGVAGLEDQSSAPYCRPTQLPSEVGELIESWRRWGGGCNG